MTEKNLEEKIRAFEHDLTKIMDSISELENSTEIYDEMLDDLKKQEPKLPKKERKKRVLATLKEKHPKMVALFLELDEFIEGVHDELEDKAEKFQDALDKVEEIDQLKEDVRQALDD